MVQDHLYQNVQIRSRIRSADNPHTSEQSPKGDKKHSSVPPQTPPPVGAKPGPPPPIGAKPVSPSPVGAKPGAFQAGVAEYSVVSQDWIEKKRAGSKSTTTSGSKLVKDASPPPLPPRDELADQLDENLYDLPVLPTKDVKKVLPSDKTSSSSSITVVNDLYHTAAGSSGSHSNKSPVEGQPPPNTPPSTVKMGTAAAEVMYDVIADIDGRKSPKKCSPDVNSSKSPVHTEKKISGHSPMVSKKTTTLPKTSDDTYDVIQDTNIHKSLTMPVSNRRTPSPEYAVVQKSPELSHASTKNPLKPNSPVSSKTHPPSAEYDRLSSAIKQTDIVDGSTDCPYDLPMTARQQELRINSPPSPMLSNYAKLASKEKTSKDKQDWKPPKQPQSSKKKTSKSVSIDTALSSGKSKSVSSVNKAIEVLEKGLEKSDLPKNCKQSLDKPASSSGDVALDWDDTDTPTSVQQSWVEKHQKILNSRCYEVVDLSSPDKPSLTEKQRHSWNPKDNSGNEKLPTGWSKVIGENGVYYWHIKSGRTQWTAPTETDSSDKVCFLFC